MPKTTKKTKEAQIVVPTTFSDVQKKQIAVVAVVALLVLALYYGKSLFVVAMVNGEPISRLSVIKQLEVQSGKKALDSIVTQTIIKQEARKQKIVISNAQVDGEIKKIEKSLTAQGQNLDSALAGQNMTRAQLRQQIVLQKMLETMVGADIKVTDKEIDAFIKENQASMPTGTPSQETRTQVADKLKQDKLSSKIQAWIADHQKKAKITYFKNY